MPQQEVSELQLGATATSSSATLLAEYLCFTVSNAKSLRNCSPNWASGVVECRRVQTQKKSKSLGGTVHCDPALKPCDAFLPRFGGCPVRGAAGPAAVRQEVIPIYDTKKWPRCIGAIRGHEVQVEVLKDFARSPLRKPVSSLRRRALASGIAGYLAIAQSSSFRRATWANSRDSRSQAPRRDGRPVRRRDPPVKKRQRGDCPIRPERSVIKVRKVAFDAPQPYGLCPLITAEFRGVDTPGLFCGAPFLRQRRDTCSDRRERKVGQRMMSQRRVTRSGREFPG